MLHTFLNNMQKVPVMIFHGTYRVATAGVATGQRPRGFKHVALPLFNISRQTGVKWAICEKSPTWGALIYPIFIETGADTNHKSLSLGFVIWRGAFANLVWVF